MYYLIRYISLLEKYKIEEIIKLETINPFCFFKFLFQINVTDRYFQYVFIHKDYIDLKTIVECLKWCNNDITLPEKGISLLIDLYKVKIGNIWVLSKEFNISNTFLKFQLYTENEVQFTFYELSAEFPIKVTFSEMKKFNTLSEFFEFILDKQYRHIKILIEEGVSGISMDSLNKNYKKVNDLIKLLKAHKY